MQRSLYLREVEMADGFVNSTNLLDWLYRDPESAEIFSLSSTFRKWTQVEIALSHAHFSRGIISQEELDAIDKLSEAPMPELSAFRTSTLNVGYPIIGLLSHLNAQLPPDARGILHLGATTQDIMDTALALQVSEAGTLLLSHLNRLGDALATLVLEHQQTLMPGRTHAQHAVPTTFGWKCAIYLSELDRHRSRIKNSVSEASCVSLYGASGTSAAMGADEREIRNIVAQKLGLRDEFIPWHASRDRFIDLTSQCANLSVTLVRLAREIVDLSRTEINEVFEPGGHHKGASSTMPQKRNPVMSEAIIGIGLEAIGSANSMYRAGEVGHERAAGEWQLEWKVIPEALMSSISAVVISCELLEGLGVNKDVMRANVEKQNGSIMAEAYMIELARGIGREQAHDLLHEASKMSVSEDISLVESLVRIDPSIAQHFSKWPLDPADYIGNALSVCAHVVGQWNLT